MNIRGVEIMKGSPNKARVVYAKVESEPLQIIANGIAKTFIDASKFFPSKCKQCSK